MGCARPLVHDVQGAVKILPQILVRTRLAESISFNTFKHGVFRFCVDAQVIEISLSSIEPELGTTKVEGIYSVDLPIF